MQPPRPKSWLVGANQALMTNGMARRIHESTFASSKRSRIEPRFEALTWPCGRCFGAHVRITRSLRSSMRRVGRSECPLSIYKDRRF